MTTLNSINAFRAEQIAKNERLDLHLYTKAFVSRFHPEVPHFVLDQYLGLQAQSSTLISPHHASNYYNYVLVLDQCKWYYKDYKRANINARYNKYVMSLNPQPSTGTNSASSTPQQPQAHATCNHEAQITRLLDITSVLTATCAQLIEHDNITARTIAQLIDNAHANSSTSSALI